MKLKQAITAIVLGLFTYAHAQEVNTKWGKPTKEELTMTEYASEPEANAVVLFNSCKTEYSISSTSIALIYHIKKRIKVLKPEGKEQANCEILTSRSGSLKEVIGGLKASAFNVVGGKTVETKMKRDQVFEEKINNNLSRTKFTIPQVKEGTVIEYSYDVNSDFYYNMDTWYAQEDIPTLYAEFQADLPNWFISKASTRGIGLLNGQKEGTRFFLKDGGTTDGTRFIFTGQNLSSIKGDKFVYNVNDYRAQVNIDINGLVIPGSVYRDFSSTWDEMDKTLREDEYFGKHLKSSSPWRKEIAESGINKIENKKERIAAVFNMLRSKLTWNGKYALYGESASTVAKAGSGSNAELNYILISMMHEAGLEAMPVIMSRRTQNLLIESLPSLQNINTFVVGVKTDEGMVYLDGSARYGYINVLPDILQVKKARILPKEGNGTWVDLHNISKNVETCTINAHLDETGNLEAKIIQQAYGCSAADMRRKYHEAKDSTEYVKRLLPNDFSIDSIKLEGFNDFSNSTKRTITASKDNSDNPEMIYINPLIYANITENPFKETNRNLPVEFSHPEKYTQIVNIAIHDNYEVAELPKPIVAYTSDGNIRLKIYFGLNGNTVSTNYSLDIKDTIILPKEYKALRDIFDIITSKNTENIVIRKKKQ